MPSSKSYRTKQCRYSKKTQKQERVRVAREHLVDSTFHTLNLWPIEFMTMLVTVSKRQEGQRRRREVIYDFREIERSSDPGLSPGSWKSLGRDSGTKAERLERVECRVRVQIKRKHFSSIQGSSRYRGAMVFAAKGSPSESAVETITTREVRPSIPSGEHEHSLRLSSSLISSVSLRSVIYRPDKPFRLLNASV